MIVMHSKKLIFLKTKKTAGSSVEFLLTKYCDDEDIITPLSEEEEKIREEMYGRKAQNYVIPLSKWTFSDYIRYMKGKKVEFYNHISALKVRKYVGKETWEKYYKVCFERNPYDKVISYVYFKYHHLIKEPHELNKYIDIPFLKTLIKGGRKIYTDDKLNIIVDKVYLYEDLEHSVAEILSKIGVDYSGDIPKLKSNYRKTRISPEKILGKESIALINSYFEWEFEMFNYKKIDI